MVYRFFLVGIYFDPRGSHHANNNKAPIPSWTCP